MSEVNNSVEDAGEKTTKRIDNAKRGVEEGEQDAIASSDKRLLLFHKAYSDKRTVSMLSDIGRNNK